MFIIWLLPVWGTGNKCRTHDLTVIWQASKKKVFISNSLPTNEGICSSVIITRSVCYRACAKVLRFTSSPNKHGRSTEANACLPRRFVGEFCQLREKKMEKVERKRKTDRDLYVVEVVEVDTTRKQLKIHFVGFSHEYDEWRDYDNKRHYFPFVRLEKNVFPRGRFAGG